MIRILTRATVVSTTIGCLLFTPPLASTAAAVTPTDTAGIRATLDSLNSACARRDSTALTALFDDDDRILLVGSSAGEVFHGRDGVARFRRFLFSLPFVFSFDLAQVTIRSEGRFGWAYVDGDMIHTRADGRTTRRPYRFSLAMVKRAHVWKWQIFHGSVPGSE
jgi:ketosteroid isomerase-like protein